MSSLEKVAEFKNLGRNGIRDFLTRMTNDYPKKIQKRGHSFYLIKQDTKPKKTKKRKRSQAKINENDSYVGDEQFEKPPAAQKRRLNSKKQG